MLRVCLVVFACVGAVWSTEVEPEPAAAASPVIYHHSSERHLDDDEHDAHLKDEREHRFAYSSGHNHRHGYTTKERKIIEEVFSPDYYEPTVVLDYRYLKSGGRSYVRGPGGQVLILPKGVKPMDDEQGDHGDYDSLIEHLRLKKLASRQRHEDDAYSRREPLSHRTHEPSWY